AAVAGDHREAATYFDRALTIARKHFGDKHMETLKALQNKAILQMELKEYKKALSLQTELIASLRALIGPEHPTVAKALHNLGSMYKDTGNFQEAINYHRQARDLYSKVIGKENENTALAIAKIGEDYALLGQNDLAITYFSEALAIYQKVFTADNPSTVVTIDELATIYRETGDITSAMKLYHDGLDNISHIINSIENDSLLVIETGKNLSALTLLSGKARTLLSIYQNDHSKISALKEALMIYDQIHRFATKTEKSMERKSDKLRFFKNTKPFYDEAIHAMVTMGSLEEGPSLYEKIFSYSEQRKSNLLRGLQSDYRARVFAGLPSDLLVFEDSLQHQMALFKSQLAQAQSNQDSLGETTLKTQLFEAKLRNDSLNRLLEQQYPRYFALKYRQKETTVAEVQQYLDKHTTLLEYYVTDSTATAMVITKKGFQVKNWPVDSLEQQVRQFKTAMLEKDLITYIQSGNHLYDLLVKPIDHLLDGERLIIVPDGPLWHLNFDVLLSQPADNRNPRDLPYLLHQYAISYASSAGVLLSQPEVTSDAPIKECLAFSYSDSAELSTGSRLSLTTLRDSQTDLPGTREEIKAISGIFGGTYYYGKEASEKAFKAEADQYALIHLALHGSIDNENFENSKLHFTNQEKSGEDNFLYSHELYGMKIPSELVVLSACNTGSGTIASGEGIMSLGNAFQFAGTRSLLLSTWELADDNTPTLMQYFYEQLKAGDNKAEALRSAKRRYLQSQQDVTKVQPFYWAGFYVLGDPKPLEITSAYFLPSWSWWLIGGLVMLITVYAFFYLKPEFSK
ncbi:MAG: CHAT domain-containing tetratricopeptide repeat protein, partial [Bacteroidota bacterium]